jgi:hypothetical protein
MSMSFRRLRRREVEAENTRGRPFAPARATGVDSGGGPGTPAPAYEPLFGAAADAPSAYARNARDPRDQVVLGWIRAYLGPRAEAAAVRVKNKTPVKAGCHFVYTIQHGCEAQDLEQIDIAMSSGRLYRSGMLLLGGAWSRLLLGPRFALGASKKQIHELNYKRSVCTCLPCQVVRANFEHAQSQTAMTKVDSAKTNESNAPSSSESPIHSSSSVTENDPSENVHIEFDDDQNNTSWAPRSANRAQSLPAFSGKRSSAGHSFEMDESGLFGGYGSVSMRFLTAVAPKYFHSAQVSPTPTPEFPDQPEFVDRVLLPSIAHLKKYLGADCYPGEVYIGELVGLHRPKSTKFIFSGDVRPFFAENAYCGPVSASQFTQNLIARATEYYKLKRGKKSRKVYLRGSLVKLPVEVGAVKCSKVPGIAHEIGAAFVLFARQT